MGFPTYLYCSFQIYWFFTGCTWKKIFAFKRKKIIWPVLTKAMRFALQCKGEWCDKSRLIKSMKCLLYGIFFFFQKKKLCTFGSKYNWYFGLIAILLIYNFSIHSSLKVRLTSSSALRAPEDSAQAWRHLLKPMSVIVYLGFLYALVICFTNG